MAKSAAERKAAQRARQAASGVRKLEIVLDAQEIEMLERNCAARRPGRDPYEMAEYIALLIRQDDARVRGRIKSISRKRCGKCGERVPVNSCPCNGDSQCWVTRGWHETKLEVWYAYNETARFADAIQKTNQRDSLQNCQSGSH